MKHCPECGGVAILCAIVGVENPTIYKCVSCDALILRSRLLSDTTGARVRGKIEVPFSLTLYARPRVGDWDETEDSIISEVEEMAISELMFEVYSTDKIGNIDGLEITVEEVIEE